MLVVALALGVLAFLRFKVFRSKITQGNASNSDSTRASLEIGYLPVTCHLTCPVTDYASKTSASATRFKSVRFSDFPTVASALQTKKIVASFMLAPLAMKMREDGVPIKICYLGHRDGSELMVGKYCTAKNLHDLKGKKIAIPSFYSNQHFVLLKLLEKQGLTADDLKFVPLPPPDMPTALATGAIHGFFVGEPFCAKAELENIGRIMYYARDIWPNFISCVLVVHEDLIKEQPDVLRDLVKGIAESGAWAETHTKEAAKLIASYYRQDPKILNYVLTSSPRRVSYVKLTPSQGELQAIADVGIKIGFLKKRIPMSELLDVSFVPEHVVPALIKMEK